MGQLTGGIAHDFNNLLSAVRLPDDDRRRVAEPAIRPMLEAGQQAVDRGAKLTQQLMTFARHQSLRPEAFDVRDRLVGMSGLIERALRADIVVRMVPPAGLWPVQADPTQFELALLNLVVNARDAIAGAGTLDIAAANWVGDGSGPDGLAGEFVIAVAIRHRMPPGPRSSVLHHQGRRQGVGPRPVPGLRLLPAVGRHGDGRQHPRGRYHRRDDPAARLPGAGGRGGSADGTAAHDPRRPPAGGRGRSPGRERRRLEPDRPRLCGDAGTVRRGCHGPAAAGAAGRPVQCHGDAGNGQRRPAGAGALRPGCRWCWRPATARRSASCRTCPPKPYRIEELATAIEQELARAPAAGQPPPEHPPTDQPPVWV
jgi:hypothetical protein